MMLSELKTVDGLLAEALVEAVGGRLAFAEYLVNRITAIAADRALATERERVNSHIRRGRLAGALELAIEAIEAGTSVADIGDGYVRSAVAIRESRAKGPQLVELHDTAAELQQAGDAK